MSDDARILTPDFSAAGAGYQTVRRAGYCGHRGVREIDPDARTVTCAKCRAVLDPFTCLHEMSLVAERRQAELARLDHAIAMAAARLAELQRQERNATARARRRASRVPTLVQGNGPCFGTSERTDDHERPEEGRRADPPAPGPRR